MAEGADVVAAGLAAGRLPSVVFVLEGSEAAVAAQTDATLAGLRVLTIARHVAQKVTTLQTPPDVMAVFPMVAPPPLDTLTGAESLIVYADGVADPGNMGTLVRAAAAFAAAALVTSPGCVDLSSPKVVRGSMGAVFALPLYPEVPLTEVTRALPEATVYGLVAHGGEPLPEAALRRPAIVCVGAERAGLEPRVARQVTHRLTIPLAGEARAGVESLNAGVAGAIALYEFARRQNEAARHRGGAARQRRAGGAPQRHQDAASAPPQDGAAAAAQQLEEKE